MPRSCIAETTVISESASRRHDNSTFYILVLLLCLTGSEAAFQHVAGEIADTLYKQSQPVLRLFAYLGSPQGVPTRKREMESGRSYY